MYAVWGTDLATNLKDPAWHQALAAAGVERLQVNLDDDDVVGGDADPDLRPADRRDRQRLARRRRRTGGRSTPSSSRSRSATTATGSRSAVRSTRPRAWDGSRADTLANVAVLRRPDELTQEEWLHRWLVDHTPIAKATQATFGYLQNVVVEPVTDDAPFISAFVEELFPSAAITDMHAFYGSGGDDAELNDRLTRLMASVAPDRRRPRPRPGADQPLPLRAGYGVVMVSDDLPGLVRGEVAGLREAVGGVDREPRAVVVLRRLVDDRVDRGRVLDQLRLRLAGSAPPGRSASIVEMSNRARSVVPWLVRRRPPS